MAEIQCAGGRRALRFVLMEIRRVDHLYASDPELFGRVHAVCRRGELHERPWESVWSLEELRARFEHPTSTERHELHAAFEGEEVLGAAYVEMSLATNHDKLWAHVMVDPAHRRRGVGTALAEHAAGLARAAGCTSVLDESSFSFAERDTHPHLRFALKNGYSVGLTEVVRLLRLPVAGDRLEALAAEAAPHHEGYRIETFVGEVPEEYVASYCRLHNQLMLDAPTGDLDFDEGSLTPESFRENQRGLRASGRTRVSTVALDGGEVVAYTDLVVKPDPTERVQQWGTLVDRAHRGHRLGAAVKVANLRRLQAEFPDRTAVVTANAEVNAQMVDINDRLGFEPVAVCPTFVRRL